ncbi:YciI family protein [Kribbella italica]|uniref:YCII-related domain-containing protein n=1 Tax=Kribbella italica TaxID=1540520 RepID=A0A7W9J3Y7_9ACTN|nr:YciI family protein [Kribbella italica]MBB5834642.1 hypothetical protein [Kribbella italica]
MKFLILIYGNPEGRALWNQLSPEQRRESMAGYTALENALSVKNELLASESLDDPALTRQVLVRDGKAVTTDGPFAEIKEQLAGFYLVECDTVERATEIVTQIPEAEYSIVEIRPVRDLSTLL